MLNVLTVVRGVRLKEEHRAAHAEESFLEHAGSEHDVYSEPLPRLSRRLRKKKIKRIPSANRDIPERPAARFEITPPPRREEALFCSRSEQICAELLKRYVPGFELKPGLTFQVAIGSDGRGNTYSVDFLVDGVLFEYHPVRFFKNRKGFGDFLDREEYRSYTKAAHALKGESRRFFHDAMQMRLKANYFKKRRALLDQHPLFRRMELVVATNPEEFFTLIIKRFGRNFPHTSESFLKVFEETNRALPTHGNVSRA